MDVGPTLVTSNKNVVLVYFRVGALRSPEISRQTHIVPVARFRRGAVLSISRLKEGVAMRHSNCTLNRRDFVRALGAATLGAGPVFAGGGPSIRFRPALRFPCRSR